MKSKGFIDSSYYTRTTGDMGKIIPIGWQEVLPGDSFIHSADVSIEFEPMQSQVKHPVEIITTHFYVRTKNIWDDFHDFISMKDPSLQVPFIEFTKDELKMGSLADYMGISPVVFEASTGYTPPQSKSYSSLVFRAYNDIYNCHYRDPDLQVEIPLSRDSGVDSTTFTVVQDACWEKNYYTTARQLPQKGAETIIPIGESAPVERVDNAPAVGLYYDGTQNQPVGSNVGISGSPSGLRPDGTTENLSIDPRGSLKANLSKAEGIKASEFAYKMKLQNFKSKLSIYGDEIADYLKTFFSVNIPRKDLGEPEILGKSRSIMDFGGVLQTAEGVNPVGTRRGLGNGYNGGNAYKRYFNDWGIVMSLLVVRPIMMLQDATPKFLIKDSFMHFFQPMFRNLDQMEVSEEEVDGRGSRDKRFGFNNIYDDYRFAPNFITAEFRTTKEDNHFATAYDLPPTLGDDFVKCKPSTKPFAFTSTTKDVHHMMITVQHHIGKKTRVPNHGDPKY